MTHAKEFLKALYETVSRATQFLTFTYEIVSHLHLYLIYIKH